jgi:type IV pilus assembly protein PilX
MSKLRGKASTIRQRGAALVVGMILLLILTVLGVSGMNSSVFGLTMASNAQFFQNAFQAAETGIDIAIDQRNYTTLTPAILPVTPLGDGTYNTTATVTFQQNTPVPDRGFSLGVNTGMVQAFHFDVVATGTAPENASSTHNQSFYIVGPGGF